jgi:hypothetical protein
MPKKEFKIQTVTRLGWLHSILSEEDVAPIKKEIDKIQSNFTKAIPANISLAGNIKKEYRLLQCRDHVTKLFNPYLNEYNKATNYSFCESSIHEPNKDFELQSLWVNFQQKYEFNPIHTHSGIFSFVLWISIPYNVENEIKYFPDMTPEDTKNACFEFTFLHPLGGIDHEVFHVDKSYENNMIVFPSTLHHAVYPFYTSDEYRISVSGNFDLKKNDRLENFNIQY